MSRQASLPFALGSSTSKDAADDMADHAKSIARKMWMWIVLRGDHGATADEVAEALGLQQNTCTPRMLALKCSGLITQPAGKPTRMTRRRRQAHVWMAQQHRDFDAYYDEPKSDAPSKRAFTRAFDELRSRHLAQEFSEGTCEVLAWIRKRHGF